MNEKASKSERILKQARELKVRDRVLVVEEQKEKLVIFSLAEKKFAFYGREVKEILKFEGVNWVPGMPEYLLGLINLRGDIESILDISFLFNLPISAKGRSHVFVTQVGDFRSGIVVDCIHDVVDIPVSILQPPINTMETKQRDLMIYEFDYHNERVSLLRLDRIFEQISL